MYLITEKRYYAIVIMKAASNMSKVEFSLNIWALKMRNKDAAKRQY